MRAILLALVLATPAWAGPPAGIDDPAFRAPFDRALQVDDPTALLELHAAAESGNTAALLALPAVGDWLRATLPVVNPVLSYRFLLDGGAHPPARTTHTSACSAPLEIVCIACTPLPTCMDERRCKHGAAAGDGRWPGRAL